MITNAELNALQPMLMSSNVVGPLQIDHYAAAQDHHDRFAAYACATYPSLNRIFRRSSRLMSPFSKDKNRYGS